LKLKYDEPLSTFAFNSNLRCYIMVFGLWLKHRRITVGPKP